MLEAALEKLTVAIEANTAELAKVLAVDEAKGGDAGTAEKKTRTTKAKAETTETKSDKGADGVTFAGLKGKLSTWLGEFSKPEDAENPDGAHPEVVARRAAVKKALGSESVGAAKLGDIETSPEKIAIIDNWFETKAKVADKGFGIGRLAADPVAETKKSDDMDI